jgi:EpsI family protein
MWNRPRGMITTTASEFHNRLQLRRFACGMVCAAAGGVLFNFFGNSTRGYIGSASLFYWWGFQWFNAQSETQHGLLILGMSVWLLIRNLRQQAAIPEADVGVMAPAGAMLGGLLLHVVGFVAEQARVSILGLLIFAWGVAALAGGPRWARAAAFPLAFMVFAIPLNALDSVGFWLRMWVVSASTAMAHVAGIGVVANGTQILSPNGRYDYDVAAACSGVRSLVALSALSLLIGYLHFRSWWLWLASFALSLPLVYIGNVVRIVAIIVAAQVGGQVWGDRIHDFMGYVVFAIVLGGTYAASEIAERLWPHLSNTDPNHESRDAKRTLKGTSGYARSLQAPLVAASIVCVAIALVSGFLAHGPQITGRGRAGIALDQDGQEPVGLPAFIGTDWIGRRTEVTEIERQVLPPDTGFSRRNYISISDPSVQVFLSIVLSGRDRTSIHRPELCLVGQGWTIRGSFAHQFENPSSVQNFPATVLRVEKTISTTHGSEVVPQLVAYYFVGGDMVVASNWDRLIRDAWNRVIHGRADRWAYVLIQTGEPDGEAEALKRIQTILNGTLPTFQKAG